MIELLAPVAFLVIVLVSIHSWFGLRIIARGIIFTDLAIGQIAAVGSAISVGFFHAEHLYLFTLAFALIGALLITYGARRLRHVEAFIGLLYVLGASAVMLVLSQTPEGMEHFSTLLATDILFTSTDAIISSSLIYALIGLVIFWGLPRVRGMAHELLFFALLAVTVTSSVQLAGVFVVFVLLIAPAMLALLQTRFAAYPVAIVFGTMFSIAAIAVSYYFDLPTGYSIVFVGALSALLGTMMFAKENKA